MICWLCLIRRATDTHEIIPRSAGGKLEPDNQVLLCRQCHQDVQKHWKSHVDQLRAAQVRAGELGLRKELK